MADKSDSDRDEPVPAGPGENIRGVATDEDFDEDEVDEDEVEDEEGGSTF